jgi:hypothetical protein
MVLQLEFGTCVLYLKSLAAPLQATVYIMDWVATASYEIQFVTRPDSAHASAYVDIADLLTSEGQVCSWQRAVARLMCIYGVLPD